MSSPTNELSPLYEATVSAAEALAVLDVVLVGLPVVGAWLEVADAVAGIEESFASVWTVNS